MMNISAQKEMYSLAMISSLAAVAGVKCEFTSSVDDDSIDGRWYRAGGAAPEIHFQAKFHGMDDPLCCDFLYPLKMKNYDDLRRETINPRVLLLVVASKSSHKWLKFGAESVSLSRLTFYKSLRGYPASKNATVETLNIPFANVIRPDLIVQMLNNVEETGVIA